MELAALVAAARGLGLDVALPLGPRFAAAAPPELRPAALAPWARGGLILLSSGGRLFSRFSLERPEGPDPLDGWTRARVEELLAPLRRSGVRAAARFPFWNEPDPLPFQRLGRATGALAPSRLGLDLHPTHGPWLAYRALLLFDREVDDGPPPPPFDPCAGCDAPCASACPAGALAEGGFDPRACFSTRLARDPCGDGCRARLACPIGRAPAPPIEALRFHQAASLAAARGSR